jgi:hypothetical protein
MCMSAGAQVCVDLIKVFAPGSDNQLAVSTKLAELQQMRLETYTEALKRQDSSGPRRAARG